MPWPYTQSLDGTLGVQLTTGNTGADAIGGGAGANATFVAGALGVPGQTNHAQFTATRRLRNDLTSPDLVYSMKVWQAATDPPADTWGYAVTSGGVNHERGGWKWLANGEMALIGGLNPAGALEKTKKQYCDDRIWVCLHEWDRLGVNNETAPGTARQRLWIFREGGRLEEHLIASITTPADIADASWYGIITDSITWNMHMANALGDPARMDWKAALDRIRIGGITHDQMSIAVQAQGCSDVRVSTTGGSLASAQMSSPTAVDDWGHAVVEVPLPDPGALYSHAIDILDADAVWQPVATVPATTAKKPGSSQPDTTVVWICHKKDADTEVWDDIPVRVGQPGQYVQNGDDHYDNPGTNPGDDLTPWQWIKCWNDQDDLVPGIAAAAQYNSTTWPDDHDIGIANAVFNDPNIDRAFAALKMCQPLPPPPIGMPATGTYYSTIQRGETLHVFTQFNSNYRSDPDDADPGWTIGDPRPTKSPFGAAQDAWLELLLTSTDYGNSDGGYVGYVIYFQKGWAGDASDPGFGGKNDHHAFYPDHREWLGWLMSQRRGLQVHGDNHVFGYNQVAPYSGWLLIHPTGANRESGNTTWDPGFEGSYPDPPDDNEVLNGYGIIESERNGTSYTLRGTVRDALAGIDRFVVERTWTDVPYVGDHGWFINGVSLEQMGVYAQVGSSPFRIAPKRGENVPINGRNGRRFRADKRHDENVITHKYSVIKPTLAEVRIVADELSRLIDDGAETDLLDLRYIDEVAERRAWAEVTASVDNEIIAERQDLLTVAYTIPGAFFEDTLDIVQELDFDPDEEGKQTLWFTATAGATAPVQDMIIKLKGNFDNPLISDPVGRGSVRYLGVVNTSNTLTIDCRYPAKVTEQDGIDPPQDKFGIFEQRGVGPLLTLKPRRSDGSYGLRINVAGPGGANPTVELTVRRRFKLA